MLACPSCGGRLRLIATVEDPDAIRAILVAGYRVAGAGRSGAAVRAGAEHQSRHGDRGLSASGRHLRDTLSITELCVL
jgi:hypothetical protein